MAVRIAGCGQQAGHGWMWTQADCQKAGPAERRSLLLKVLPEGHPMVQLRLQLGIYARAWAQQQSAVDWKAVATEQLCLRGVLSVNIDPAQGTDGCMLQTYAAASQAVA